MEIITTIENIKELLREQRELCSIAKGFDNKNRLRTITDAQKEIILKAPEPKIKDYKILNDCFVPQPKQEVINLIMQLSDDDQFDVEMQLAHHLEEKLRTS